MEKRNLLLLLFLVFCLHFTFAQDIIILKNGDEIKSKVTEIANDFIKYRKYENIDGPTYNLSTNEIFMIKYENGTKEMFNKIVQKDKESSQSNDFSGSKGTFVDERDGQIYNWVKIGDQIWMAQNLAYDGEGGCWDYHTIHGYKGNVNFYKELGKLYNWETACKVCPDGWHLPSEKEWFLLQKGWNKHVRKFKANYGWIFNKTGTNEFGFSALPNGYRHNKKKYHLYYDVGHDAYWWTSDRRGKSFASYYKLSWNSSSFRSYSHYKSYGLGVRCVKD